MDLISERLLIRNLKINDLEHLIELERDPEVLKYSNSDELISSLQMSHALKNIILSYRVTKFGIWAIEDRSTDEFIGTIAVLPLLNRYSAEIGFRIRKTFRDQGFATEAVKSIEEHFSESVGITKFIATVHPQNLASRKVLTKRGYKMLGLVGQGYGTGGSHETVCWFERDQLSELKASEVL